MSMRAVIATHNRHKAGEMITILSRAFPDWEFLTLADFPNATEPEETGTTYAENAAIKSESAAKETGCLSIADDAGLEIDAMNGEPGLYSKRFAGEDTPFPEKMKIILDRLSGVSEEHRSARFRCCVAISIPNDGEMRTEVVETTCEGRIAESPSGSGGFGYDPIFWLPEMGCTMADLTANQKHAISHRGKALALVEQKLREL